MNLLQSTCNITQLPVIKCQEKNDNTDRQREPRELHKEGPRRIQRGKRICVWTRQVCVCIHGSIIKRIVLTWRQGPRFFNWQYWYGNNFFLLVSHPSPTHTLWDSFWMPLLCILSISCFVMCFVCRFVNSYQSGWWIIPPPSIPGADVGERRGGGGCPQNLPQAVGT